MIGQITDQTEDPARPGGVLHLALHLETETAGREVGPWVCWGALAYLGPCLVGVDLEMALWDRTFDLMQDWGLKRHVR